MKLLRISTPWFTAGAEYHDNGEPTQNVAPILRKHLKGKTLGQAVQYFSDWSNTSIEWTQVENN